MNLKAIIKVMNFHALVHVDKAHRDAERYMSLENEVIRMIDLIQNNRNLILDKQVLTAPKRGKKLCIFIGSDLGFCGAVNASVNAMLNEETDGNDLIIIGKKIHSPEKPILTMTREELEDRFDEIEKIVENGMKKHIYTAVELCYDHFHNMSHIEPVRRRIFPVEIEKDEYESYDEDFAIEGANTSELTEALLITYLNYEIKIAAVNAYASENVLREAATNESLKKIDEMETEAMWQHHKEINEDSTRKVIDSFTKTKHREMELN